MSLTNILSVACTLAVAGVVGHTIHTSPAKKSAGNDVVAYIGAPVAPAAPTTTAAPERDIVAELLAPAFVIDGPKTQTGAAHFGGRTVTDEDIAQAKLEWKQRLSRAMTLNRQAAANPPRATPQKTQASAKRSSYRPSGRAEKTNRTMFERSRRVRRPTGLTYGLPNKKRASRRIRRSR